MNIGLICEGITDYIVLENILCGFGIDDEDIKQLQPLLDETDKKQASHSFGGWEQVLLYLQSTDFVEAAENHDYLVIQIDTDICEQKNFGVSPISLAQHNQIEFYALIKQRLINKINERYSDNFIKYNHKIIFCICIHSLECWLLAHYQTKKPKNPKITGCEEALSRVLNKQGISFQKDYRCYDNLSRPFLQSKNINNAAKHTLSFDAFIQQLNPLF